MRKRPRRNTEAEFRGRAHSRMGSEQSREPQYVSPLMDKGLLESNRPESSMADLEPVDPIAAMEGELAEALRGQWWDPSPHSGVVSERSLSGDRVGDNRRVLAKDRDSCRARSEPIEARGAVNFSAWLTTRRELEGNGATFVVEVKGADGSPTRIDLMRVEFQDLPAPIQAEFENQKSPDLSAFTPVGDTEGKVLSEVDAPRSETLPLGSVQERRAPRAHTARLASSPDLAKPAAKDMDPTATGPTRAYESARPWPVQAASGFGINLGGLLRGTQRAVQGTGRATGNQGRSASNTVAALREALEVGARRQPERIAACIYTWRKSRANEALERVMRAQAQFDTTLRIAREHPELRSYFRSWDPPSTAATRQRSTQRFRDAIVAGRIGKSGVEQVGSLFQQAEAVRVHAARALRQLRTVVQDTDAVQRSLATWFKSRSEQAGPLTSLSGESLAEKLAQMADAIGKVFEQLADRIAHLTTAHPK